jgi:hypothetical protein
MPAFLAVVFFAGWAALQAQPRAPFNESIRRGDLEADLSFLASDSLRGRLTGTAEYLTAARFIEARFRRLGLQPLGESFFHTFSLTYSRLQPGNRLQVKQGEALRTEAGLYEEFYPLFFSASAEARGPVVFAGYGIRAPQLEWDDLAAEGIEQRIVLILGGEPGAEDPRSRFDGLVTSVHSDPLRKALALQERGAAGVLIVNPGDSAHGVRRFAEGARGYWPEKPPHLERYALSAWAERLRIPVAQVSPALAQSLLGARRLADVVKQAEKAPWKPTLLPGVEADLRVRLSRQVIEDRNVVAKIDGGDPGLKEESILVTAHYDHNGAEGGQIYPGADDNGSGTVGLLEIAEAYALAVQQGQRPQRTVVFVAWGSEERCCGPLLGAWAWTEYPPWPLDKTVAVLNMDMIGRDEEVPEKGGPRFNGLLPQTAASNANAVNVLGFSFNAALAEAARRANRATDLLLRFRYDNNKSNLLRRSDHWVFLQAGVPALWFHTGLHPDYHTPNDRPERIRYDKAEKVARLVHQLSWDLANRKEPLGRARRTVMPEVD